MPMIGEDEAAQAGGPLADQARSAGGSHAPAPCRRRSRRWVSQGERAVALSRARRRSPTPMRKHEAAHAHGVRGAGPAGARQHRRGGAGGGRRPGAPAPQAPATRRLPSHAGNLSARTRSSGSTRGSRRCGFRATPSSATPRKKYGAGWNVNPKTASAGCWRRSRPAAAIPAQGLLAQIEAGLDAQPARRPPCSRMNRSRLCASPTSPDLHYYTAKTLTEVDQCFGYAVEQGDRPAGRCGGDLG
ncbi:MAG: hypothetical protein MZW92_68060 [Comamonadaceae bacterium]|nr:hypothetical protein [Comamonadaceae bacterium]